MDGSRDAQSEAGRDESIDTKPQAFKVTCRWVVYLFGGYSIPKLFLHRSELGWFKGDHKTQVGVSGSKGNAGKKIEVCFVLQPLGKVCLDGWEGALPE